MTGVLLCDDLIFTSRVVGTAKDLGLAVQAARSLAELEKLVTDSVTCLVIDLHHPELAVAEFVTRFRKPGVKVIGYGSHVAADVLAGARQAGCDVVWPRSKFVSELAAALPGWLTPGPGACIE